MTGADFATLEPSGRPGRARSAPATDPVEHRYPPATQRMQIEGRAVVLKRSTGRLRSRARAEADVLGRLGAAPVVELVARRETDESTDLVLADAGRTDLAEQARAREPRHRRALRRARRRWLVRWPNSTSWAGPTARCAPSTSWSARTAAVRLCSLGSARPSVSGGPEIAEDRRQLLALVAGCASASACQVAAPGDRRRRDRDLRRLRRLVAELERSPTPPAAAQLADRLDRLRRDSHVRPRRRRRQTAENGTVGPARPEVASPTRCPVPHADQAAAGRVRSSTRGRRILAGTAAGVVAVGVVVGPCDRHPADRGRLDRAAIRRRVDIRPLATSCPEPEHSARYAAPPLHRRHRRPGR